MSAPYRARPSSLFDLAIILLTVAALGSWIVSPESRTTGLLLANAAIGNALRFIRWNGYNAGAEPLVWILHVGYAWVPLGLLFLGISQLDSSVPVSAGIHALTAGAVGTMTVAVMTRATLGHSGQVLQADGATFCIYALLSLQPARALLPLSRSSIRWSYCTCRVYSGVVVFFCFVFVTASSFWEGIG